MQYAILVIDQSNPMKATLLDDQLFKTQDAANTHLANGIENELVLYQVIPVPDNSSSNKDADIVRVGINHVDSTIYGGELDNSDNYIVEITNNSHSLGMVGIDVAPINGDTDDVLCTSLAIMNYPGTDSSTQVALISTSPDNIPVALFKRGDDLLLQFDADCVAFEEVEIDKSHVAFTGNARYLTLKSTQ